MLLRKRQVTGRPAIDSWPDPTKWSPLMATGAERQGYASALVSWVRKSVWFPKRERRVCIRTWQRNKNWSGHLSLGQSSIVQGHVLKHKHSTRSKDASTTRALKVGALECSKFLSRESRMPVQGPAAGSSAGFSSRHVAAIGSRNHTTEPGGC